MKKLDHEEVKDYVAQLKKAGLVYGALAQAGRDFGVSRSTIHSIVSKGKTKPVTDLGWWSDPKIDWTKSNQEIGKQVGKEPTLVQQFRLRHGKPSKRVITFTY